MLESRCNGVAKKENLSSNETLITYKRKKRARTSESFPSENGDLSAKEDFPSLSTQCNGTDFGCEHGSIVNANSSHWKCNWCKGYNGGVARLKKHITDGPLVSPCSKVPKDVARKLNIHPLDMENINPNENTKKEPATDGKSNSKPDMDHNIKQYGPFYFSETSKNITLQSRNKVDNGKTNTHWRYVLNQMLQLTDGGSIKCCIDDALIHLPSRNIPRTNMTDINKEIIESKHKYKNHVQMPDPSVNKPDTAIREQTDADDNNLKCQKSFFSILCSEEFVMLCNLVCGGIKVDKLFNIKHINLKMKSGVYGLSPGIFFEDLQQMWENIQRVGEEMVVLARSLSNMSKDNINFNMDKDDLVREVCPKKLKPNCTVGSAAIKDDASGSGTQIIQFSESVPCTKLNQTVVPMLYKACNCRKCGSTANVDNSLICDECEAAYHLTCLKPAVQSIPTRSWYCDSCNSNKETTTESSEAPIAQDKNTEEENLHGNCTVCEKLEIITETKETLVSNTSMEANEAPATSTTAQSRLCKLCGTCEDEDKRFLICEHSECPYKYYHIRCLKNSQVAGYQQRDMLCWYCPSCLCRGCFCNKDDDKIVLCDGCDEAHHTYCMKPPRASVPKGQWYCLQCNVEKAKEGVRRYEQWVLQQHGKKAQVNEPLISVEKLTTAQVKKKKKILDAKSTDI